MFLDVGMNSFKLFYDWHSSYDNPMSLLVHFPSFLNRNHILESKPCYVSILPSQSPSQSCHSHTIHFKFELLLPSPSAYIDIYHSLPGELPYISFK